MFTGEVFSERGIFGQTEKVCRAISACQNTLWLESEMKIFGFLTIVSAISAKEMSSSCSLIFNGFFVERDSDNPRDKPL